MTDPSRSFQVHLKAFKREAKHIDEVDIDALHRARVASRRLREVLPVLGLEGDASRNLNADLKKVTRKLGEVRELDVLHAVIGELGRDARYSSRALKHVDAAVEAERAPARDRLASKRPMAKMRRLTQRLEHAVEKARSNQKRDKQRMTAAPARGWVWALEARLTRRAIDLQSAIEAAGSLYAPDRLHEVRIASKKLRYALEVVVEARSRRETSTVAALQRAQHLLGRLHDLEVLIARARVVQASSSSPPDVEAWRDLSSLIRALEEDCRALHAQYMHQRIELVGVARRISSMKHQASVAEREAAS